MVEKKAPTEVTRTAAELWQRYAELIDKKFLESLNPDEEVELQRIEKALDEAEVPFYEPIENALRCVRDELVARRTKSQRSERD